MSRKKTTTKVPVANNSIRLDRWRDFLSLTQTANLNPCQMPNGVQDTNASRFSKALQQVFDDSVGPLDEESAEETTFAIMRSDGYVAFVHGSRIEIEDISYARQCERLEDRFNEADEDEDDEIAAPVKRKAVAHE
jgi:hypothetical protein